MKVSPGATVSGAATVTDAAGVLVTLIVADARHVVVKSTVVVAAGPVGNQERSGDQRGPGERHGAAPP
ncbi:hypothetical protein GS930_19720 [Rhodococcus hoagii]|nr:hypothetical protein [Prescottella equi]